MLGALGGAAALVLAYVGLRLLVAFGPTSLPRQEISIDPFVLAGRSSSGLRRLRRE